ncbi:MAG TPA: hypothetical protein VGO92_14490, partial [Acidimicrobiales bacterium]|nr:hypothetical protein [Acidimicrobiales bacterium]
VTWTVPVNAPLGPAHVHLIAQGGVRSPVDFTVGLIDGGCTGLPCLGVSSDNPEAWAEVCPPL